MKTKILIFLLCINSTVAFSQSKYAVADSLAAVVKGDNISAIHSSLTKNLKTDEEKVRAFYSWIAHNIRYDVEEYVRKDKLPIRQETAQVLKMKKGLCQGYSTVFRDFCKLSGIPCYYIVGFARIDGKYYGEGHSWDIVFVNGKWQQVDATWGAGKVDNNKKYVKEFTEEYFFTEPVAFLAEHYPLDPMWQLVNYPVKQADLKMSNWSYKEKTTPYFSFNDTIAKWEQLDSLQKNYTAAQRMLRYSPDEPIAKQELSYAYFDLGDDVFEKGNIIINEYLKPSNQSDATTRDNRYKLAQLDSVDNYYKQADFYYRQVKPTTSQDKAFLKTTFETLKYNGDIVKGEKVLLKK